MRSIPVKRNSLVVSAVLLILAAFAWAGWANFESRRQAAAQFAALVAKSETTAASAASNPIAAAPAPEAIPPEPTNPLVGKSAPKFTLEDLDGKKISLADYKGKALAINFWATWCAPCKIETPWLIELRKQYAAQGFEVLGISADDLDRDDPAKLADDKKEIADFVEKMQMPYPVLIDADSISKPYGGLDELPATFYVDRKGTIVAAQLGLISKAEIEANIKKALGN
jgi:cytochrome c biogenesis protein CcmG/thiol:disulfide interchange protein DsbE